MITNKELNAVKLSPTKKDFYQIWNELLETAGKISDRWDPVSTNESDPGIVLLKVLTAIADKLNYNIDVNTLEAFMPSAAQEESMRKLTEMLGYNMKYYQSATTEVKISYEKHLESPISGTLTIDKFTNLKDIDDSINYVTLAQLNLNKSSPVGNVECMEGELVECETADNNIVSMFHLDDNKRYFLPETQVAENGIFITNIENNIEGAEWRRVDNLNAQSLGSKVFKFGFDSQEGLPYIQFPDDISTIIEDGLRIKYIRTTGGNGNIAVNTLTKLTTPYSWSQIVPNEKQDWHDIANFTVTNIRAATNGANREGINSAYNNFKKTVGTFDTLVTCRDYMNKIYQLVSSVDNTTPLVSNVIVSDIKSDINRAVTLGTFTSRGLEYKVIAKRDDKDKDLLTHFDLVLYPFKSVYGLNSKQEFIKSFTYDKSNRAEILTELEDCKTLSHNFIEPTNTEIACIKNYYKLRAKINTVRLVGAIEQASILNNIYKKLFETFNMRQLDFGEEIPYDTLLKVIETADPRIKTISLDEPTLKTVFLQVDGDEVDASRKEYPSISNQLALNNGLAGHIPLFNYNTDFKTEFTEQAYPTGHEVPGDTGSAAVTFANIYPTKPNTNNGETEASVKIHKLKSEFYVPEEAVDANHELVLTANEVIQFRAPNLKTVKIYPAFVNYYFYRNRENTTFVSAIPATMQTLGDFLKGGPNASKDTARVSLEYYVNDSTFPSNLIPALTINQDVRDNYGTFKATFDEVVRTRLALFIKNASGQFKYVADVDEGWAIIEKETEQNPTTFYALLFEGTHGSSEGAGAWNSWIVNLKNARVDHTDDSVVNTPTSSVTFKGLYKHNGSNFKNSGGYLVDSNGTQFKLVESAKDIATVAFNYYYVPRVWTAEKKDTLETASWHTKDGLGQDADSFELPANVEYELKEGEYLLFQWMASGEENSDEKIEHTQVYKKGDIIKPNFRLSDSEAWHKANHSYTKQGVADKFAHVPIEAIDGMFTLGTNEQIEVRSIITVELNSPNTNLYWDIPGLVSTKGGYMVFPFDEAPINKADGRPWTESDGEDNKMYSAYTLKEGETLCYTDMNKSNIAMYGFGTTITRGHATPTIFKYTSDDVISSDQIATNGINASIPWRNYKLDGRDAAITIVENQFINLTEGDTLLNIDLGDKEFISNEFIPVGSGGASWKLAGADVTQKLPVLQLAAANSQWQVRSKLNLAMGPTQSQTLLTKEVKCGEEDSVFVQDRITLINTQYDNGGNGTDRELITLRALEVNEPLALKANKFIQSATTVTDVTDKIADESGQLESLIEANLRLKLFKEKYVLNKYGQIINFDNFGDGKFTTINFEEQLNQVGGIKESNVTCDLNVLLPENHFGLVMFYYDKLDKNAANVEISWTKANNVTYFNEYYATDEANNNKEANSGTPWIDTNKVVLREGINILKITSSDVLTLASNNDNRATITFSSLDLIPTTNSVNPKLNYHLIKNELGNPIVYDGVTIDSVEKQLLMDIRKIDKNKEFYYNMPIAQNLDIDMNPNDPADTLANPLNWFNYNNVNNKFVIAQIDTKSLADDIVIAKSSRSNY